MARAKVGCGFALLILLGRQVGFAELQSAARAVATLFREAGWIVSAHLPQQDVTNGIVTIRITESRFSGVYLEDHGARRLNPTIALGHVLAQQETGQPLSTVALDRALLRKRLETG